MRCYMIVLSVFIVTGSLFGQSPLLNLDDKGVVIDGYDPVAYFTGPEAVAGSPDFQTTYKGSIYYFVSLANKQRFDSDPKKYEVQFGGFCAYAVSQGHVSPIDPKFCKVQQDEHGIDRLICQHNQKAADLWNKNSLGLLADADRNWPAVVKNGGKQIPLKGVEHFLINIDGEGLANQGYDVVAYHTDMKAVKGDARFAEWFHGAKYLFISAEHRALFRNNPRQYLPQYGGFCAYAMSLGKLRPVDPEIFSIENGRLMLQHTKEAYYLFTKDVPGNIARADSEWPDIERKRAGHTVRFDKPAR